MRRKRLLLRLQHKLDVPKKYEPCHDQLLRIPLLQQHLRLDQQPLPQEYALLKLHHILGLKAL